MALLPYPSDTSKRLKLIVNDYKSSQTGVIPQSLEDGDVTNASSSMYWLNNTTQYLDVNFNEEVNIWRYPIESYSGYTGKLKIQVWNGVSFVDFPQTEAVLTTELKWTKLFTNIPRGRYKFLWDSGTYRGDAEWFVERVVKNKILLSSNSKTYSVAPTVYATETAIPQMTSNITPSGMAFASSVYGTGYEPWKAFDRNVGDYYSQNSIKTGHLGYEFSKRVVIGRYTLTASTNTFAPKDWTFEASNDGEVWTVLDTQINQSWTANNTDKEYTIDINKTNSYKMYRLNWGSNNGGGYVIIREFKMYERMPFNLLELSNQSEQTFMKCGMEPTINPSQFNGVKSIESNSIVYESGKIFEHTIDMSKRKAHKIILG